MENTTSDSTSKSFDIFGSEFLKWLSLGIFLVTAIVGGTVLYFYFQQFSGDYSANPADWGTFGDYVGGTLNPILSFYVGGTLNPILSFLALIALLYTLML